MISAFTKGTTNEALIHELGQGRPRTIADLIDIATIIDVEDTLGAIFRKGKSPHNVGELSGEKRERWENPDKRRRNHRPRRGKEEVATMDRPPRPLSKNDGDQFQKLMNSPCQNHDFPVLHKLQEYELLKCFVSKPPAKKDTPEEPTKPTEQEAPIEDFLEPTWCLMIFDGAKAYGDRRCLKVTHREVHIAEPLSSRDICGGQNFPSYSTVVTTRTGSCTQVSTPSWWSPSWTQSASPRC